MAEYEGSPNITLSRVPRAMDSEDDEAPRQIVPIDSESPATLSKKPRGRPPGSKNKPKPPVVITRESESAMRPVVLELAAGADVLDSISGFARRRRVGVSVISGSGAVTNVTLRHPSSLPSSLTLHGRFDILSLSGTFLPAKLSSSPSSSSSSAAPVVKSPFTVSLAGAQGQVIGGAVTGSLTAAGPVVLLVATFGSPEFCRLPGGEEEEEGDSAAGDESRAHVAGSGEQPASSMGCQVPAEVLPWTGSHFRHSHQHF